MKTAAVRPARICFSADGTAHSPDLHGADIDRAAALAQARRVFLDGNQLPSRWAGRDHFTVLETGFGLGDQFIATWAAWQRDAARCGWLHYVAIEPHPPARDDLARAHAESPLPALAQALAAAWPPLTPNVHALEFEAGRVRLLLAWGDTAALLGELACAADAFYIDQRAATDPTAVQPVPLAKSLARRAAPGATAASLSTSSALAAALVAAGFELSHGPASDGAPAFMRARWQPRFVPRGLRPPAPRAPADVVVVGAGLAGACTAHALHRLGWQVQVFDQHPQPAHEASGNPAGVFHGTVHPEDGTHARLLRAAALQAQRSLHPLLRSGCVAGQASGVLRAHASGVLRAHADGVLRAPAGELDAMRALLAVQGLPADCVQALDRADASRRAGVALPGPAWFYPGGGWLAPRSLVEHLLQGLPFVGATRVAALRPAAQRWQLLGADGQVLAEATAVVLANAAQAAQLLAPWGAAAWPLQRSRGQLSHWQGSPGGLALPVAGDGYALPLSAALGGGVLCGATSDLGDDEAGERAADHGFNLERLARLCALSPPAGASLHGRVAWRVQADDKLPVVGPLPLPAAAGTRGDQARLLPRRSGLFVCTALGGRGITLAPLLGALVAAQVAGTPLPLEQGLLDAIDPGRWQVRAARRG